MTLFDTASQARLFLLLVGYGAAAGMLYDLLTLASRGFGKKGRWLGELLFAAALGLWLLHLLLSAKAPFRPYVLLGACVGWFLYAATLSCLLRKCLSAFRKK